MTRVIRDAGHARYDAIGATDAASGASPGARAGTRQFAAVWERPALVLAAAVVARLALAALSLHLGFVEYNADGFTRVIHGFEWLQSPHWEVGVWLPLQFWLLGGVLALWRNLYAAPKLLATVAGLATMANLYLIARGLAGRRPAALAALLAATFPFEVWFSVSGMSEPLFYALLSGAAAGLVWWWLRGRTLPLAVGSVALCAATAVRYEAWFYAVVYAALVLGIAWRQGRLGPAVIVLAGVPFVFAALWVEQSAAVFGDPLAFAHQTAAIKAALAPRNATAGLARRLTSFPLATFRTSRVLITLEAAAVVWLAATRWRRWWPYLALVLGEAVLLVAVSAAFTNLGPSNELYLMSNVVLLLPVLAAATVDLWERHRAGRVVAGLAVLLLAASFARDLAHPPTAYPDPAARALGSFLRRELAAPDALGRTMVPVLVPQPPVDAYNASYALRILSGHPDAVTIVDQPVQLDADVASGRARLWVVDTLTGAALPPSLRTERIDRYVVGWPPPLARAAVRPGTARPGGTLDASGGSFQAGEPVFAWLTAPDGHVVALPAARADGSGNVVLTVPVPAGAAPGTWALTLSGGTSHRQGIARFQVAP
ncbi:MAG TPA: hypothetical protein VFN57_07830 [Thermomicrobiaceae bacterium]|nr:hypothetical protein [Thermomicrobiaceae bacterium]